MVSELPLSFMNAERALRFRMISNEQISLLATQQEIVIFLDLFYIIVTFF
jgi:hypothetical protein